MEASNAAAFSLCMTDHGMMIIPTWDYYVNPDGTNSIGVGHILRTQGAYDLDMVAIVTSVLAQRHARDDVGQGVAIDGGANVGVYTIEMARAMKGWGRVIAFEPQRAIYHALAGNCAINNCLNVDLIHAAVGDRNGLTRIPEIDYTKPGCYGGLQLEGKFHSIEKTGREDMVPIHMIDSMALGRLDLLKLDIEGMEMKALRGAAQTIKRCKPFIMAEWIVGEGGHKPIDEFLHELGYVVYNGGIMRIGLHKDDSMNEAISVLFDQKEPEAA